MGVWNSKSYGAEEEITGVCYGGSVEMGRRRLHEGADEHHVWGICTVSENSVSAGPNVCKSCY